MDGDPVNNDIVLGLHQPLPVQVIVEVVWRVDNRQGAHRLTVIGLGQVGIAVLDVFLDVFNVRVIALFI